LIRLFTALPISPDCVESMSLMRRSLPGVRWIDRENLHLTLQFIGEVDHSHYRQIVDALDSCSTRSFNFDIRGGGFFGTSSRPRVLWAGVEDCPQLLELNRWLRSCLDPLVELEQRKYKPHISLARLKQCSPQALAGLLESVHYLELPGQQAHEFCLYSSKQGPKGSQYAVEARFPFTK
jgi:2'-5' RNA ligase